MEKAADKRKAARKAGKGKDKGEDEKKSKGKKRKRYQGWESDEDEKDDVEMKPGQNHWESGCANCFWVAISPA